MDPVVLAQESIDAIAHRVLELQQGVPAKPALVDAATLARELGLSRETVYRHALDLGGVKVGHGKRPRWRFDLETARRAAPPTAEVDDAAPRRRRRPRNTSIDLLPIRGHESKAA